MKNLWTLLVATFLCTACTASEKPDDKSLLWRISGPGLSRPSYLFGTIHLICPDDYLWTPLMKKSLAACDKVCFELDLDDPGMLAASTGFISKSDKSLRDHFTDEQYARLSRFVRDSLGVDLAQLQMIKPMMLEMLLMTKAINCGLPVSYEDRIMKEATDSGKEITGLETLKDQLDLLDEIPDDSASGMLLELVDSFSASRRDFAQMLAHYKAQDLPALYRLVQESDALGEHTGAFLEERNKKWIPRISLQMKEASVFFAVGAAHLYGDAGVINLLRQAGYSLEPVR